MTSQKDNIQNKYIYKKDNKYYIYKMLNGRQKYFGRFKTLDEAIEYREFLINHHWDTKYVRWAPRKYNLPRYVYYNPYADHYYIAKKVGDTQFRFGTYKTRDKAIHEKEFYESINWDLDLLDLY